MFNVKLNLDGVLLEVECKTPGADIGIDMTDFDTFFLSPTNALLFANTIIAAVEDKD